VASIKAELILQLLLPLRGVCVARIRNPAVRLHECHRAEVFVLVPPVGGTRGGAARAEDALVQAVELSAVFLGLEEFAGGRGVVVLEVGLDGFVLFVEVGEVWDEVFYDVHWVIGLGRVRRERGETDCEGGGRSSFLSLGCDRSGRDRRVCSGRQCSWRMSRSCLRGMTGGRSGSDRVRFLF
jgi:hypothetical protein